MCMVVVGGGLLVVFSVPYWEQNPDFPDNL